jgi:hypothetical protein
MYMRKSQAYPISIYNYLSMVSGHINFYMYHIYYSKRIFEWVSTENKHAPELPIS